MTLSYEIIEEDGTRTLYDDSSNDDQYSTDLSAQKLREFVADAVSDDRPFFAYWAPYAPHLDSAVVPAQPADRHYGVFSEMAPWRPPSWNEADVSDKPIWVQNQQLVSLGSAFYTDLVRIRGYEALLSVDEQIGAILDQLVELGVDRDTVIFFTSDNGASWGEHRWFASRKGCAYEECQRVPMVVRYPRRLVPGMQVNDAAALNIDLPPTIAALAGVEVPVPIDGVSFEAVLLGIEDAERRTDYLMESWRVNRNSAIEAQGMVSDGDRVRLYYGDPIALPRDSAVFEFDVGDGVIPGAIAVEIVPGNLSATLGRLRQAVLLEVPEVQTVPLTDALYVVDLSPEHHGVIWFVEQDLGGILSEGSLAFLGGGLAHLIPDFLGVRDVVGGFTWVEYETGERELYDLVEDPFQLENRADDPDYQEIRADLEDRLQQLLDETSVNALP